MGDLSMPIELNTTMDLGEGLEFFERDSFESSTLSSNPTSYGLTETPIVFADAMTVLHKPSRLNPLNLNSLCLIFAIS